MRGDNYNWSSGLPRIVGTVACLLVAALAFVEDAPSAFAAWPAELRLLLDRNAPVTLPRPRLIYDKEELMPVTDDPVSAKRHGQAASASLAVWSIVLVVCLGLLVFVVTRPGPQPPHAADPRDAAPGLAVRPRPPCSER